MGDIGPQRDCVTRSGPAVHGPMRVCFIGLMLALASGCRSSPRAVGANLPARFLDHATATMKQLATWRGRSFKQDVHFALVADDDRGRDGWYDADQSVLVLVDQPRTYSANLVLVHELTHALQDQHFDLSRTSAQPRTSDAARAWRALVEGEATLASAELVGFSVTDHPTHADGPRDPEADDLLFTYMAGAQYVSALRQEGGWAAVDAAWQTPPPSTDHILRRIASPSTTPPPPTPDVP